MALASPEEQARYAAWIASRQSQVNTRAAIEANLAGDPAAVAARVEDWRPRVDASRRADWPEEEIFPDSEIVVNQNVVN
jgi:hypothetical protein